MKFEQAPQTHTHKYEMHSFGQLKWPSQFIRMNYESDCNFMHCAHSTVASKKAATTHEDVKTDQTRNKQRKKCVQNIEFYQVYKSIINTNIS